MVPECGTYRTDHSAPTYFQETTLSSFRSCFEIVHFAFRPDIPFPRQVEAMHALGRWAATQPGFVTRQSYHDSRQARWTDVVEWSSLGQATAAMERSQREPALASVMALIEPSTVHAGHFEKEL